MELIDNIIGFLNNIFWGYILIYGLLAVGLFFTIRLKFIQFLHFKELFSSIFDKNETDESGITPLQALTISLASRVGTGNLTGVAVALYLGGAGAIFWMWMVALVGMATAYSESTLAQLYKIKDESGTYRGGPAFYIAKGLKSKPLAILFSLALILSFGLGGIRNIAKVAEIIVPIMALLYLLVAIYVIITNITLVPEVLKQIFNSAFGLEQATGGITGGVVAAMMNGVKRGLFSNEAGMGSAPNIAAVATPNPHHPSSQGFVQALGVFIDTILICTATAIMILLSGLLEPGSGLTGIELTQEALSVHIGSLGTHFVAIAILFFAFTSIIGNYSYAENAFTYLGIGNIVGFTTLRCALLAMVIWGALQKVGTVFNAADASMGLMATINLIAIVLLSGTVAKLTNDYLSQRKAGLIPTFDGSKFPELKDQIDTSIWK